MRNYHLDLSVDSNADPKLDEELAFRKTPLFFPVIILVTLTIIIFAVNIAKFLPGR